VRAVAVLGVVGARGIGFELVTNMRLFEFQNLVIIILSIYHYRCWYRFPNDQITGKNNLKLPGYIFIPPSIKDSK
jgi:hypothetical protein